MSAPGPPEPGPPGPTRTHLGGADRLAPGTVLAERYRIEGMAGVGGMGIVYRAWDQQLDLRVALKVLRPEIAAERERVDRFRRELVLARQVSHPNVVRIHDLGRHGEMLFLTMDFIDGRSLRAVLDERGTLDPEEARTIALQLARALEVAHAEGVVHRDLKPENVLLDGSGQAYVTDFGIAGSLAGGGPTRTGDVLGTLDYLSPEQARGEAVDERSDLWAVGVVLFELLSGELPFPAATQAESLAQRIGGRPRDLSQVVDREELRRLPGPLVEVVRRCLEPRPARRWRSATELARALKGADGADAPARHARRRRLRVGALAAALLVVSAGGLWWWLERPAQLAPADGEGTAAPARPAMPQPIHSVAILPFVDETGSPELGWLEVGLAELLSDALEESPALRVVDSLRVVRTLDDLKIRPADADERSLGQLAELLDADRLLVARVRRVGGELRIDPRMAQIDLAGGVTTEPLASQAAARGEIAPMVAGLAEAVGQALELSRQRRPEPATTSPEALAAFSRGVESLSRGDLLAAEPALARATTADPGFAAAWLRLSQARAGLGYLAEAREAADRALGAVDDPAGRLALESRAQRALLDGEPDRAAQVLEELVERFPHDVEAAVRLAEAQHQAGELARSIATLERVVAADPSHPRAWYLLARSSILAGDSRPAVEEYLVRALVIQNRLRNDQGKADVLNAFGVGYGDLGELDLAAENYREAAELRRAIGDRRGYATTLRNLAQIDTFQGRFEAARESLEKALEILREIGDSAGVAALHNDFGILDEERGDYRAALTDYRRALEIRQELGDDRAVAESLNNVGYTYYLLGDYPNARVYWSQALALYRETGNREGEVLTTQSIAQLEIARGELAAAAESLHGALEASRELGLRPGTAVSLGYLGRLAHLQGRYGAALASYDEALAILDDLGDLRGLAEFTLGRAATLQAIGLDGAAEEALERAAGWLEETGNREQQAELEMLRAAGLSRRGEPEAAAAALGRAAAAARDSHGERTILEVRLARAELDRVRGDGGGDTAELEAILAAAEELGHAALELAAGEALAAARLADGRPDAAEAAVAHTLARAEECGAWGGSFRLHLLRARAARARGAGERAARAIAAARREVERIRRELGPERADAFAELPEVRAVTAWEGPREAAA